MDPIAISLISFAFIFGGTLCGYYLGGKLPDHHLGDDSRDSIKMTWGIIATMSALVLSLLVASAKNSFDTVNSESTQAAAKLIVLNHTLIRYGPRADPVRNQLRLAIASAIKRDWPDVSIPEAVAAAPEKGNVMEAIQDQISQLVPASDAQRALLSQAQQTSADLSLGRWLVIEQSKTFLSNALFVALVFWLTILFIGLGLFAPHNNTVLMTLILGSLSVSVAIYLINDLSHPLKGLITVSPDSMLDVLHDLSQ